MNNLGLYEKITTDIKKLGGPKIAIPAVGGGLLCLGALIDEVSRMAYGQFKKTRRNNKSGIDVVVEPRGKIFKVNVDGIDNQGLHMPIGSQYRVLERDGDAVLIEVIGGDDNPYMVSSSFLQSISNFRC